ncbi:MAG TPA: thioesterase family protein [Candidatus Sulfotelmatobacter sp.]|nr:thioesterase family protein [Candidatus Sulfotelmatobacter sp.]
MTGWTETYRGMVAAWECDAFAHLTIAFYFDRLEDCTAALTASVGATGWRTVGLVARYRQELRANDGFHAESGIVAAERGTLVLAHKFFNSVTGAVTTLVEQTLMADAGATAVTADPRVADWEAVEPVSAEQPAEYVPTGRSLVKPGELDATGGLAWANYVHRFSASNPHILSRIGMTTAYMREAKQGFSTFETRLTLLGARPKAGDMLAIESGILRMGNSSIAMLHRMIDVRADRAVATFHQSGVQLDMVARRSKPWPDEIRRAGAALLGKATS